MRVKTRPLDYGSLSAPTITIHVLKENRRPVGFAPWPDEPSDQPADASADEPVPGKKRKKRKKNG